MSDLLAFARFLLEQLEVDKDELLEAFFLQERMNGARRDDLAAVLEEEE